MSPSPSKTHTKKLKTFEEVLVEILADSKQSPVKVKELLAIFSGRLKIILVIFLCLPFGQVLGLAVPFGLLIGWIGILLACNYQHIWMPDYILNLHIHQKIIEKIIPKILSPLRWIKPFSYPRSSWICSHPYFRILNGSLIAMMGLGLAVALPIPLVSFLGSAGIFLIGIGILNDDGLLIQIGYATAVVYLTIVVVTLNLFSMSQLIELITNYM